MPTTRIFSAFFGSLMTVYFGLPVAVAAEEAASCSRLKKGDHYSELNQVIDCLEARVKALEIRSSAGQVASDSIPIQDSVEASNVTFSVHSARMVTDNRKKTLQVVLSLTNTSSSNMAAIVIGPPPTAIDENGRFFIVNHKSAIKGVAVCSPNYITETTTDKYCADSIQRNRFSPTPLHTGVSVNSHLSFTPDDVFMEVDSEAISVTATLLLKNEKEFESVSVTLRGVPINE